MNPYVVAIDRLSEFSSWGGYRPLFDKPINLVKIAMIDDAMVKTHDAAHVIGSVKRGELIEIFKWDSRELIGNLELLAETIDPGLFLLGMREYSSRKVVDLIQETALLRDSSMILTSDVFVRELAGEKNIPVEAKGAGLYDRILPYIKNFK